VGNLSLPTPCFSAGTAGLPAWQILFLVFDVYVLGVDYAFVFLLLGGGWLGACLAGTALCG
jgi:hypothetical protein